MPFLHADIMKHVIMIAPEDLAAVGGSLVKRVHVQYQPAMVAHSPINKHRRPSQRDQNKNNKN